MATEGTNRLFAATDKAFIHACEQAKVKPTARQASKWRNKKGSAYKAVRHPRSNTRSISMVRSATWRKPTAN